MAILTEAILLFKKAYNQNTKYKPQRSGQDKKKRKALWQSYCPSPFNKGFLFYSHFLWKRVQISIENPVLSLNGVTKQPNRKSAFLLATRNQAGHPIKLQGEICHIWLVPRLWVVSQMLIWASSPPATDTYTGNGHPSILQPSPFPLAAALSTQGSSNRSMLSSYIRAVLQGGLQWNCFVLHNSQLWNFMVEK